MQADLVLCKCWFDINRLNPDYTTLTKSEYESEAWHGGFTKPHQSVAGLLPPGETEGPSALCRLTKILIPSVLAPAGGILPTSADTVQARPGLLPLGEGCCSFPGSRSQTCSLRSSASRRPYTVGMTPVPCTSLSPPTTMDRFRVKKGRATNPPPYGSVTVRTVPVRARARARASLRWRHQLRTRPSDEMHYWSISARLFI